MWVPEPKAESAAVWTSQFCWYFRAGALWVSIFWITVRRTQRATSLNKFLCSTLWNPLLVLVSAVRAGKQSCCARFGAVAKGAVLEWAQGPWLLVSLGEENTNLNFPGVNLIRATLFNRGDQASFKAELDWVLSAQVLFAVWDQQSEVGGGDRVPLQLPRQVLLARLLRARDLRPHLAGDGHRGPAGDHGGVWGQGVTPGGQGWPLRDRQQGWGCASSLLTVNSWFLRAKLLHMASCTFSPCYIYSSNLFLFRLVWGIFQRASGWTSGLN